jgi:hypothetical protein
MFGRCDQPLDKDYSKELKGKTDMPHPTSARQNANLPVALLAMAAFVSTSVSASAQQSEVAPEIVARMAKEKEARRACKVEICTAFAKPDAGAPIACDVTKTWTQQDITTRIVGGSYVWRYGQTQCTVKLALDRALIAKAMREVKTTVSFPEHTFICNVDDADPSKGRAFSVNATITPVITFENGQAKSVTLEPVKTEGSSVASAAVTSLIAVDKVSGLVSRAAVGEINAFLFEKMQRGWR